MTSDTSGIDVYGFTNLDQTADLSPYIATLEIFDAIPQLQELKVLARKHVRPGDAVLDVGCGFRIESFKLAPLTEPGGKLIGRMLSTSPIMTWRGASSTMRPT